ncbi:MAG: NAD(P)H-dependent oxidoreductase [Chloroflexota bacterium]
MSRVLILFAHPALEKSRVHRRLIREILHVPDITFHDLYEEYPSFAIDVPREQELLTDHDIVIQQHPFFWYSTPAILKQWEDLVLEHGWAYGSKGVALKGKWTLNLISAGGREVAYRRNGYNRFTIRELLAPIEQTAYLCKMQYLPPYVIFGTHGLQDTDIDQAAQEYLQLLIALRDDLIDLNAALSYETMNEVLQAHVKGETTV